MAPLQLGGLPRVSNEFTNNLQRMNQRLSTHHGLGLHPASPPQRLLLGHHVVEPAPVLVSRVPVTTELRDAVLCDSQGHVASCQCHHCGDEKGSVHLPLFPLHTGCSARCSCSSIWCWSTSIISSHNMGLLGLTHPRMPLVFVVCGVKSSSTTQWQLILLGRAESEAFQHEATD